MKSLYLVGSLRNPDIPALANFVEKAAKGWSVFDEWYSAGPTADDTWRDHQKERGRTYLEALKGPAAANVFAFDKKHIDAADVVCLVSPAGKSGHLEIGYAAGRGKTTIYLLDDPERWDVMLQFCDHVVTDAEGLVNVLNKIG